VHRLRPSNDYEQGWDTAMYEVMQIIEGNEDET
jgi:hypothetical protein